MGTYRGPDTNACPVTDAYIYECDTGVTPRTRLFIYQMIYLEPCVCLGFLLLLLLLLLLFFTLRHILRLSSRLYHLATPSPVLCILYIWHSSSICIMYCCCSVRGAFNSLPYNIIIIYRELRVPIHVICICGYICSRTQKTVLYSRRRRRRYPTPRGEPIFYFDRVRVKKTRSLSPKFHLPRSRAPFFSRGNTGSKYTL